MRAHCTFSGQSHTLSCGLNSVPGPHTCRDGACARAAAVRGPALTPVRLQRHSPPRVGAWRVGMPLPRLAARSCCEQQRTHLHWSVIAALHIAVPEASARRVEDVGGDAGAGCLAEALHALAVADARATQSLRCLQMCRVADAAGQQAVNMSRPQVCLRRARGTYRVRAAHDEQTFVASSDVLRRALQPAALTN